MEEEALYMCPKCGRPIEVTFSDIPPSNNKVNIRFECVGGQGLTAVCDFFAILDLLVVGGKIIWPSQKKFFALSKGSAKQAFLLCKRVDERPELEGPFVSDGAAIAWMHYLLYALPEVYCREHVGLSDPRIKIWVLRVSDVPRWVFVYMRRVLVDDEWWWNDQVSFRPDKIADPEIREIFIKQVPIYPQNLRDWVS